MKKDDFAKSIQLVSVILGSLSVFSGMISTIIFSFTLSEFKLLDYLYKLLIAILITFGLFFACYIFCKKKYFDDDAIKNNANYILINDKLEKYYFELVNTVPNRLKAKSDILVYILDYLYAHVNSEFLNISRYKKLSVLVLNELLLYYHSFNTENKNKLEELKKILLD